jgi:hypothetical protein
MKLTHRFLEMTPEKRPQDRYLDGTGLRFETMEHGGEYRSCIYVPTTQDGKVVDSQGFTF